MLTKIFVTRARFIVAVELIENVNAVNTISYVIQNDIMFHLLKSSSSLRVIKDNILCR